MTERFAQQREILFRARCQIFSTVDDLGGAPTMDEEEQEGAIDSALGAVALANLSAGLMRLGTVGTIASAFSGDTQRRWQARTPGVLAFGARVAYELVQISPDIGKRQAAQWAAGSFQLAASLLDWIGDEGGGGDEVQTWLPPERMESLVMSATARKAFLGETGSRCTPSTQAFFAVLCLSIEAAQNVTDDLRHYLSLLHDAYVAEVQTFGPIDDRQKQVEVASARAVTPSLVIGELARLATQTDRQGAVWQAVLTVAPVFGIVDDIADITADLLTGHPNSLLATFDQCDTGGTADTLTALLASNVIEAECDKVRNHLGQLYLLLGTSPDRRSAVMRWLRTALWRWLA